MKFKLKRSYNFWLDFIIFKLLEYKRLKKKTKDESLSVIYNNDYISNEVIAFGSYEKDLQNSIFKFLYKFKKKFSKGTCLDVGANIGTFSINNSKYFKKIYGFEPETKSFKIYKLNSSSKNNIFPLNFGLGNKNCYKELYVNKINRGESSLRPKSKKNKLKSKIKIQKLDTTNINLTNLSFIKVDIEDTEDDFFKGARKTIETFKPIIAFEYRNKTRQNLNFPILQSDYHFFKYEDNNDQNYSFFRKRILNFYEFFLGKKVNISKLDNLENKDYSLIIAVPSKDLNKLPINFNRKKLNIKIKILNYFFSKIYEKYIDKLSIRSKNPYITHYPILIILCRILKLKKIVEFGSGQFSTINFNNKNIFPSLSEIVSYEDNFFWYKKIKKLIKNKKIKYFYVNQISNLIKSLNLKKFDLIFVDNSMNSNERIQTIQNLGEKNLLKSIVFVHDFEYYPYREAAKKFKFSYRFKSLNPNSGILWNNKKLNFDLLKKIDNYVGKITSKKSIGSYNKFFKDKKKEIKIKNFIND